MSIYKKIGLALLALSFCTILSATPKVEETEDLSKLAKISKSKSLPILMVFSSTECTYCEILEYEFLKPMLLSGDYQNKILIRKINLDEVGALRDFSGKLVDSDEIVSKFNISVTPTILFFDSKGKELAKRLIGVGVIDFFGGVLDNAIDKSLQMFRKKHAKLELNNASK